MKINSAESFMRDNGFRFFRVRHHDEKTARIEIGKQDFHRIFDDKLREQIVECFKNLGFVYVTLDLQGYRRGSLNIIPAETRNFLAAQGLNS